MDMIRCKWQDGALRPYGYYQIEAAREIMSEGDVVAVSIDHPRSQNSHAHQFATITDMWRTLPEKYANHPWAANADALRKFALIQTGYRQVEMVDAGSKAAAERVAVALARHATMAHGYAHVSVQGATVVCITPESQSMRAMGGKRFQESKQAVLDFIADLIGVQQIGGAA